MMNTKSGHFLFIIIIFIYYDIVKIVAMILVMTETPTLLLPSQQTFFKLFLFFYVTLMFQNLVVSFSKVDTFFGQIWL